MSSSTERSSRVLPRKSGPRTNKKAAGLLGRRSKTPSSANDRCEMEYRPAGPSPPVPFDSAPSRRDREPQDGLLFVTHGAQRAVDRRHLRMGLPVVSNDAPAIMVARLDDVQGLEKVRVRIGVACGLRRQVAEVQEAEAACIAEPPSGLLADLADEGVGLRFAGLAPAARHDVA